VWPQLADEGLLIDELDSAIEKLLGTAPAGSLLASAAVAFDIPDAQWRAKLQRLTVNCYLYDIRENREMRTNEPLTARSSDGRRATRIEPPIRIDCAYCITAWSTAETDGVREEHRLLSQVLRRLLQNETLPASVLGGSLATQIPPYPLVIASKDGVKNQPEFWNALDQRLKPSLNYVVTLAMLLEDPPGDIALGPIVTTPTVTTEPLQRP
jgi:hypothetical protein